MSDYRISNGVSSIVAGTGVLTVIAGAKSITGSGTTFLTQLHAGDILIVGGVMIGSVASVTDTDDALLTYNSAVSLAVTAFTVDPLVTITSINTDAVDPLGSYYAWSASKHLANGLERSLGRARANWLWKNIGLNLRTGLKVYCPIKSARVYIRTLSDPSLGTFSTYQAAMIWPDSDNAYTPEFTLEFRDLVLL
jgi:hypothetical protein